MYLKSLEDCLRQKKTSLDVGAVDGLLEKDGLVLHIFGKNNIVSTLRNNLQKEFGLCECEEADHKYRRELWVPVVCESGQLCKLMNYVNTFNSDRKDKVFCELY